MLRVSYDFSVILPTYNEAENIVLLIKQILQTSKRHHYYPEIVVIDDDSPDQTATTVKQTFKRHRQIKTIVRKKDRGLAPSIREGILRCQSRVVVVMDTDFNHDPKIIPFLYQQLADCDVSVGSRFVKGGGMEDRPRYWLSFFYNLLIRLYLNTPIRDNLSGFFAARKKIIERHCNINIFNGFGEYFIRLVYELHKESRLFKEIPVFYKMRFHGLRKSNFMQMFITYTRAVFDIKTNK